MMEKALVAIDLGTNSCRCLVCDTDGKILFRDISAIRLGKGMNDNGFTDEAYVRGVEHFIKLGKELKDYQIVGSRYVATAACRMAKNGKEFIDEVEDKSGIKLEIIDTLEETRLTLKGAISHVFGKSKYVLVYDIGGGSTEVTLAENNAKMKIIKTVSIPLGARNASEKFEINDYNKKGAKALVTEVENYLQEFSDFDKYRQDVIAISASGMATRLASYVRGDDKYDRDAVDGVTVKINDLDRVIAEVYKSTFDEREKSPYSQNRADIFVAPSIMFKTIYDYFNLEKMVVSLRSAKDGIMKELFDKWQKQQ